MIGERQRVEFRIGDRKPPGGERAGNEARRQAGLDLRHLVTGYMAKFDPVIGARGPAGKRSLKFRLALIDLKIAILAQHGKRAAFLEERFQLGPREIHQRRLRRN